MPVKLNIQDLSAKTKKEKTASGKPETSEQEISGAVDGNQAKKKRKSTKKSSESGSKKKTKEPIKPLPKPKSGKEDSTFSTIIQKFQSKYGEEVFRTFSADVQIPAISTGSIVVDKVVGIGGIPRGRFVEFCGWESTGKTTLALQTFKCALDDGMTCAYLDFEQALDPDLVRNLGISFNNSDCVLFQPPSFEAGEEIIDALVEQKFDLIVIDSIPAMVPMAMQEVEPGKTPPIGLHARMVGNLFKKLISRIKTTNTTVLCINHVRADLKASAWNSSALVTPGGSTARFLYSVRLYLQVVKKVRGKLDELAEEDLGFEKIDVPTYNIVRVTAEKNKVGLPYRQGEFALVYGEGVDNAFTIIQVGKEKGVIKMGGGGWYSYEDPDGEFSFKIRSESQVRKYLNENPEIMEHLVDKLGIIHRKTKPVIWVPSRGEVQETSQDALDVTPLSSITDVTEV